MLDRLREEKAIEARGGSGSGPVQALFDLGSGGFRGEASADGGKSAEKDAIVDQFGEDATDVLDAISDLDVNETPPVELLAKVQEWQAELDAE